MTSVIVCVLIVSACSAFAAWIYFRESNQLSSFKIAFQDIAARFGGQFVETGRWSYPKVVFTDRGVRFHLSAQQGANVNAVPRVVSLEVSADGMDPGFLLSITLNSITRQANAWWEGKNCKTGISEFDSRFLVSSNQFRESINEIVTTDVAETIARLSHYEQPQGMDLKTDLKTEQTTKASARRRRSRFLTQTKPWERFEISVAAGRTTFAMHVLETETDRIPDFVAEIVALYHQLDTNYSVLAKSSKSVPEQ